jgi:hypothetical protein
MMWLESRLDSGMGFVLSELQKIQNESVSRLDSCSPFSCSILGMIAVDPARLNSTAASENPPSVVSAIATQRSMVRKHQYLVERAHGNRNSADERWTVGAERSAAPTALPTTSDRVLSPLWGLGVGAYHLIDICAA